MALDGTLLYLLREELSRAVGCRVQKINMPTREEMLLALSARGFSANLFIAAGGAFPRIQFTKVLPPNPAKPPMFCMLLRKMLGGARLAEIRQNGLERVLFLDFDSVSELGDPVRLTLCCEMMGRRSNIILVGPDGKMIDAVRRSSPEAEGRLIHPGAVYEMPPLQGKLNWLREPPQATAEAAMTTPGLLSKALCAVMDGVSPLIGRELAFLSCKTVDARTDSMSPLELQRLSVQLERLREQVESGGTPTLVCDPKGTPFELTYCPVTQYGMAAVTSVYPDYSSLLDAFYAKKDQAQRLKAHSAGILKALTTLSERTARKINHQRADLEKTKDREQLRIYGELLKANLHAVQPGDPYCDAVNYYDPDCHVVRIPLNVALSPAANAQKYFKDYRKASAAAGLLGDLIEKGEEELKYFDSVFDELSRAETLSELDAIRDELTAGGYVKDARPSAGKGKRKSPPPLAPLEFRSDEGFTILVGRNNRQNDSLTLGTADKTDLWLHTKGIHGSHVIVRCEGKTPGDTTVTQAAVLAAFYSKGRDSAMVPVDYTLVKHVKKPAGAKPGMVIYTTNETAYVAPDGALAQRLRVDNGKD